LIPRLSQISPRRIVVEATGGLERALLRALVDAALPVIAVNPRPGRDVAQATGQLAKPDALDAAVLARFAAVIHPPERALPDPQTHVLALQRAGQSRLDHASARGQKRMEVHVRGLGAELARLEEDLSDMSEPSPVWRPGVGRTAGVGAVASQASGGLGGVAPFHRDSSRLRGRRTIWGGRAPGRTALSRATWGATRWNPVIRPCYQRLRAAGNPPNRRKLLTILNAMVHQGTPWRSALAQGA
ncbi:MAG: Transposase, partial [Nitrospira sp.]|nr:Transposase [Nitrospira sp.]